MTIEEFAGMLSVRRAAGLLRLALCVALLAAPSACSPEAEEVEDVDEEETAVSDGEEVEAEDGEDIEVEMGNECEEDEDCDDHVDCTVDTCEDGYCGNDPDDEFCNDDLECNGVEVCNAEEGCLPGEIFRGCNDDDPCTMDICIEGGPGEAPHCDNLPLDRDDDGHIDIHCEDGDDCNDLSDRVYPGAREWCFDDLDNDCDDLIDFNDDECAMSNDTCDSPRELFLNTAEEGFSFEALADISSSCDGSDFVDVAFSFTLESDSDVIISVSGRDGFYPYVAIQAECGVNTSTIHCASGNPFKYCRRGMEAGTYFMIVSSWDEGAFDIRIDVEDAGPSLEGDNCDDPIEITGDGHWEGDLLCMEDDLTFSCASWATYKDMVFSFTLSERQDVVVRASSIFFSPYVSVHEDCDDPSEAIVCDSGYPFDRTITRMEPGDYTIAVESYTAGDFSLDVAFQDPSEPPENETCDDAVDVSDGGLFPGSLLAASDDYAATCMPRYIDVFYTFSLDEMQDVRIEVGGGGEFRPFIVLQTECGEPASEIKCYNVDPADLYMRSLPEGDYWIVIEAEFGGDFDLFVEFLPPTSACDDIEVIEESTTISDTTEGKPNDFESDCGYYARSPDMAYILRLSETSNIVAEVTAAPFDTILHMRTICDDFGSQIICDDDSGESFLSKIELEGLEAGDYILIMDGYGTWSWGDYTLDITIEPFVE